jgi:hypothetical protein
MPNAPTLGAFRCFMMKDAMTVFKQIAADQAAELTDSIVISVGAEDEEGITAAIS